MKDIRKNRPGPGRSLVKEATLIAVIIAILAALHLPLIADNIGEICDDAMISARYAQNLARGHGLTYNRAPADARPVEGYSNFLWVMGLCLGEKLLLHPRITTLALGGLSSMVAVLILACETTHFLCQIAFTEIKTLETTILMQGQGMPCPCTDQVHIPHKGKAVYLTKCKLSLTSIRSRHPENRSEYKYRCQKA